MDQEQRKKFLINLAYYISIIAIIILALRYALSWLMPFVLGLFIAMLLQSTIRKITLRWNIQNKIVAMCLLTLFYVIIGGIFSFITLRIIGVLSSFFADLPTYYKNIIEPSLTNVSNELINMVSNVYPGGVSNLESINESIGEMTKSAITSFSSSSLSVVTSTIAGIPSFLISFLFTIISSYFFVIDYRKIVDFILLQCNEKTTQIILGIKNHGLGTVGKFIKSYGIIMTITFVELAIGLTLIGVDNAIPIALLIAIFDILPVLGTGGIMIPWILITLLNGNVQLAIGLLAIYVVVTIIRNIIEPKIVGGQVGAHPIVMLICMFIGARLLGVLGIFLLPILIIILKNLNEEGIIHLYKTKDTKKENSSI